jgi:hypothetical protein
MVFNRKAVNMNPDPNYQRWREIAWRRPLTESEQAELRAWLLEHPELQQEAELDEKLNQILAKTAPPVSSNFAARVWQEIERENRPGTVSRPVVAAWWRKLVPRLAVAVVLVVGGLLLYRQQMVTRQNEMAQAARQMAQVEDWSASVWLTDFETIASLSPVAAVADEELLAFSDDLLALTP